MRYFFQTMCFPDARLQDGLLVDINVQFFFKFGIILKTYFPELHTNSHIYLSIITLTVIKVILMLIFQSPYFVHPERLPSQVCEFIEVNDDANRILNIRSEMFEPWYFPNSFLVTWNQARQCGGTDIAVQSSCCWNLWREHRNMLLNSRLYLFHLVVIRLPSWADRRRFT